MPSRVSRVTVVIPCFNEQRYVGSLLESIRGQDYPQGAIEILVVDGMSTDRTRDVVADYASAHPRIRWIENRHRFVPSGLNLAIRQATGEVVVRMDAHAEYPPNYLRVLTDALFRTGADNVGGACETLPSSQTAKALAIALAMSHPLGVGNSAFRLGGQTERFVDTVPFGCFRRELFDRIGFFDEQLLRNQDDEFNGRILRAGGKVLLIPTLRIRYFARDRLRTLSRMFYQYGLFKPLVNIKLGAPATARQFAPPGLVLAVLLGTIASPVSLWARVGLVALLGTYGTIVAFTSAYLARSHGMKVFVFGCLAFPAIHGSYGVGYIVGLYRFVVRRQHTRGDTTSIAASR